MKLPPWTARNQGDRRAMHRWVNDQLDALLESELTDNMDERHRWMLEHLSTPFAPELEAAERGDFAPLQRALLSHVPEKLRDKVARFVSVGPHRKRGRPIEKWNISSNDRRFAMAVAIADVDRIRTIWQREFGRKNRKAEDGPSAVDIAAARWEVDAEDLERHLKNGTGRWLQDAAT